MVHSYAPSDWTTDLKLEIEGPGGDDDDEVSCRAVQFAPDGLHLAAGYADKSVALIDAHSGEFLRFHVLRMLLCSRPPVCRLNVATSSAAL